MTAERSSTLRKLAIVPAFNESAMVGRVIRDIGKHAPDFDVVVVDDGSTDQKDKRIPYAEARTALFEYLAF